MLAPADIDLTTLLAVKNWIVPALKTNNDDDTIQSAITGFSRYALNRTGRDSFLAADYDETYDGNGATRLFLRNNPINSVASVQIFGVDMSAATDAGSGGYFIDRSKKALAIRGGNSPAVPASFRTRLYGKLCFGPRGDAGIGAVRVCCNAGYVAVPEDLEWAARMAVTQNYKRRDWVDLESKSESAGGVTGTTRYRNWTWPPEVETVLCFYERGSLAS